MEDEYIKALVTKYALTSGIKIFEGCVCHSINSGMFRYGTLGFAHGNDWHRTSESAVARAEEMRKKKISSLKKSIEKMEKLEFKLSEF